jgi:hypothetical protein
MHHEHADRDIAHDERRRHQRREAILARLGKETELRMLLGVFDGERRSRFGDEPDESFAHGKVHLSDGFGCETAGGAQRESLASGIGQVDRAHVRIESLATRSTTLRSVSARSCERDTIPATSASSMLRCGMTPPCSGPHVHCTRRGDSGTWPQGGRRSGRPARAEAQPSRRHRTPASSNPTGSGSDR